jgi:hypothetical protein
VSEVASNNPIRNAVCVTLGVVLCIGAWGVEPLLQGYYICSDFYIWTRTFLILVYPEPPLSGYIAGFVLLPLIGYLIALLVSIVVLCVPRPSRWWLAAAYIVGFFLFRFDDLLSAPSNKRLLLIVVPGLVQIGLVCAVALRSGRVRLAKNACHTCGYCLIGNTSGRCPECGGDYEPGDREDGLRGGIVRSEEP